TGPTLPWVLRCSTPEGIGRTCPPPGPSRLESADRAQRPKASEEHDLSRAYAGRRAQTVLNARRHRKNVTKTSSCSTATERRGAQRPKASEERDPFGIALPELLYCGVLNARRHRKNVTRSTPTSHSTEEHTSELQS